MPKTFKSEYLDTRNGGYYVAGTRVSLESVVYAFRRGESPEAIRENFPAIGSLAKIYGTIAFVLDHAHEVDDYLAAMKVKWEEARRNNPADLVERVRRLRQGRTVRST